MKFKKVDKFIPSLHPQIRGFSVAEAMITLLIVSVAISAAAPIITRRTRNIGDNTTYSKWFDAMGDSNITRDIGNVGIGVSRTKTPDGKLEVVGSENDNILVLKDNRLKKRLTVNAQGEIVSTPYKIDGEIANDRGSYAKAFKVIWFDDSNNEYLRAYITRMGHIFCVS